MLPPNLLIIDPNLHFSRAAAAYLLKFREVKHVDLAADADEAFQIICTRKPDALLIDYTYFLNNGHLPLLCEQIKQILPGILIIALTLFNTDLNDDFQPGSAMLNGLVSKQDFAKGVTALFDLPLYS